MRIIMKEPQLNCHAKVGDLRPGTILQVSHLILVQFLYGLP